MKKIRIITSGIVALQLIVATPLAFAAVQQKTTSEPTQADRIAGYKKKLTTQPTATEQANLKAKCKASQAITKTLATKVDTTITSRQKTYDDLYKSFTTIVQGMKDADKVTDQLINTESALQTKVNSFKVSAQSYKTLLADLNEIDCVADPVGFKATLEETRTARATVNKDMVAVRTYLETTVKQELKTAKDSLTSTSTNTKKEAQ